MMKCPAVELDEDIDPRDFVLSQNKARRHLTQSQLGMATTAVYEWVAPHRPRKTEDQAGESTNKGALSAHLSESAPERVSVASKATAKTAAEMAAMAGVSERTIKQSKQVITQAAPEVVEAVKAGRIGLPKAVAISKLPQSEQAAAIGKPLAKKAKQPKQAKQPKKAKRSIEPETPPEFELTAEDQMREMGHAIEALQEENQRLADRLAVYEWAPHARPRKTEDDAGAATNKEVLKTHLSDAPTDRELPAAKAAAKTAAELAAKAGVDESTIKQPPAKQAPCQRR